MIEVVQPKFVCFVSNLAFTHLQDLIKVKKIRVSHPSSPWWNRRKNDNTIAREYFSKFIQENIKI